jgi:hypothetical protein
LGKNKKNYKAQFRKGKAQAELGYVEKAEATLTDLLTKNASGELIPSVLLQNLFLGLEALFNDGTLIIVVKTLPLSTLNWLESVQLIRRGRKSTIRSSKVRCTSPLGFVQKTGR